MTAATKIIPPTTFDQMSVYAFACFQLPNVQTPASGTTASSISAAIGKRSHSGHQTRNS